MFLHLIYIKHQPFMLGEYIYIDIPFFKPLEYGIFSYI